MTNKERRARAKRLGVCIQCNTAPASPDLTKCGDCRAVEGAKLAAKLVRVERDQRRAALKGWQTRTQKARAQ